MTQLSIPYRNDPKFDCMYVRTEYPQLLGAGGLFECGMKYYPLFKARVTKSPHPMFTFPSGAKIRYKAIENTSDAEKYRGLQHSAIFIDEITQLEKEAVLALLATLRSEADMNSFAVGTLNPHKDNWVFDLVHWYLDEEGYIDKSKNGQIRYFVVKDNNFLFADEEDWFLKNMPECVTGYNQATGEEIYLPPKKFCFVQLTIFSNPILIKKNPRYLSELQNLPDHERAKQLYGCWYAEAEAPKFFKRAMIRGHHGERVMKALPPRCMKAIAWDKASSEYILKTDNDVDFTASIHMARTQDGKYIIYGDWHPEVFDEHEKCFGKFRQAAGRRNRLMLKQAEHDGHDTYVIIARDSGGDGKTVYEDLSRMFVEKGFKVKPTGVTVTAKKWGRFEPFLAACELGLVYIIEDSFGDPRTLELFYKELEQFAPTMPNGKPWRSTRLKKDDWCDVCSDVFNYLAQAQYIPSFVIPRFDKVNEFDF